MSKIVKNLSPKQVYTILSQSQDAVFIDIRTFAENKFVGRPECALHLIPWVDEPDWEINPDFVKQISNIVAHHPSPLDTPIILLCRSGNRSLDAGKLLLQNGYTDISHVATGFEGDLDENDQRGNLNGWRHDGLPWIQC